MLSHLGTRDAEPLELHSVGAGELRVQSQVIIKNALNLRHS